MVRHFFEDQVLLGWHGWLHLVCHTTSQVIFAEWCVALDQISET